MKVTNSCLIYSCLIFGIGVVCDRKLVIRQTVSSCTVNPENAFNCSNGLCIETLAICDGQADCSDGSDETNDLCARQTCQSYKYRCEYGACVDNSTKCDGKNDCVDGSDENLPECIQSSINSSQHIDRSNKCLVNQYKCISGQCINEALTCDGTRDCNDGSDETLALCETFQCENNTLRCEYGACVNKESKCDGISQCADGSDEEKCIDPNAIKEPITLKPVNNITQLTTQSNIKNFCVLPTAEGVIYSYEGSDEILSHEKLINTHRIVIENCEIGYLKTFLNSFRVCQENGKWTSKFEKLCFKCGRSYIGHQLLINNGKPAHVGTAPWNAGIYRFNKESSEYDLICGGSLISPNLVVSAAHCFWKTGMLSNIISINDSSYKIAVGKYDKNYTVIDNDFTQIMDVETIYLKEDFYGYDRFYSDDIAVIVLPNRVNISSGVAPVCVDWNGKYNVTNGTQGKIVGWGITENYVSSPALLEATLPYIDHNSCQRMYTNGFQKFVTIDKFCAGSASGQGVRQGDSGAGITFLHSDFYYLTGIVSLRDPNTDDSIGVFTNVKHHIKWLRELYYKYTSYENDDMLVTKNACVLPTADGVIYSYEDSDTILSHETLINPHRIVIENCEVGYHKVYSYCFRVCQGSGKWISISEICCLKTCPPLISDSLDIKCTLNGNYANCSNSVTSNTIAIALCKPTHAVPNGQKDAQIELRCQSNGMWNNQLYKCIPYCGRDYSDSMPLIDDGKRAIGGTAPWNVAIYKLNKESFKYDLICGGSLISPNLVVSAAHCFWRKGILSNVISINNGSYTVAAGEYKRNYTDIDNKYTQIMNVEKIYLKNGYNGTYGFHGEDIAVIVLKKKMSISLNIAPVCIDWNGRFDETNGTRGKIFSWRKKITDISSPPLLVATLSYIDQNSCRTMYTNGFQKFVTIDKFCAGSTPELGVFDGVDGSGLTFLHFYSDYLIGVMSVKEPNINNSISVFTDVKYHIQWIRELYNKYTSYEIDNVME